MTAKPLRFQHFRQLWCSCQYGGWRWVNFIELDVSCDFPTLKTWPVTLTKATMTLIFIEGKAIKIEIEIWRSSSHMTLSSLSFNDVPSSVRMAL